ncbi:NAD(P)/FAD-dependent oxidoreductase [Oceanibacterium hippocampi]|uniref:Amine oxidase domain-containing protein n=1 Tax=Oceanibacterium hippocampi TaxID=745714 RepID=A0A1Y5RXW0_9PROT|nr:FAD-dependent oxidoreductase [Oceanibacterium hippocampi]SLN28077.1 hypothetical protein OCH7691_00932 [Oceanibacterium hippocampi]
MAETRVAVIGAGMAGLACARRLSESGVAVTVFEAEALPGGRMRCHACEALLVDHGAQYFTASDPRFRSWLTEQLGAGRVTQWHGRIVVLREGAAETADFRMRYVGVPNMESAISSLAGGIDLRLGSPVASLRREAGETELIDADGRSLGRFRSVAVAVPAQQAATLLADIAPALAGDARQAPLSPCWAVMLGFRDRLRVGFEGAFIEDGVLSWIARNDAKPGRDGTETWLLHAAAGWSEEHRDKPEAEVAAIMTDAFLRAIGRQDITPDVSLIHFWPYAQPLAPLGKPCLYDPVLGIGACGDWCLGSRVESAYISGLELGDRLVALSEQDAATTRRAGAGQNG